MPDMNGHKINWEQLSINSLKTSLVDKLTSANKQQNYSTAIYRFHAHFKSTTFPGMKFIHSNTTKYIY